jgi:hypothetical protein
LAENQDPQKVAAKPAKAHRQSLLRTPCGSHPGCEQLVGAFIIEQLAHLDAAQLLNLGITSAVDLLVYASATAAAADTNPNKVGTEYVYVAVAGGNNPSDATARLQHTFAGLLQPLKPVTHRKMLKLLAEKAVVVLPPLFDAERSLTKRSLVTRLFNMFGVNTNHAAAAAAAASKLSVKEWAAWMHVPVAALAALEALGVDVVADVAFIKDDEIKRIALQLMETSFLDAWWFEHAVVHTRSFLRAPTGQHTTDEL